MLNDLKYALRVIRRFPLSSSVVIFTIAIMVAISGLFYSAVRTRQATYLPFEEPERLLKFWRLSTSQNVDFFPPAMFWEFQRQTESFEKLGAVSARGGHRVAMTGIGEAVTLNAIKCTGEALEATGFDPVVGRYFSADDEMAGNQEVVILSEKIWKSHLDQGTDLLGQSITLNGRAHTVIGVAPQALHTTHLASEADLWMPDRFEQQGKRAPQVRIVGRLKDGVDAEKAQAEIDVLAPQIAANLKIRNYRSTKLATLDDDLRSPSGGPRRAELFAAIAAFTLAGCVVLIACFNMACLLLVQSTSRARELAVRLSIGAGRGRIVRQLLLEGAALAIIGGAIGAPLSFWLMKLADLRGLDLVFDPSLYLAAFGGAILIGALVSMLPALRSGRTDLVPILKDGSQSSAARQRHRTRNFLVGSQVGMATVLTVMAIFFGRGLLATLTGDLNFAPDKLIAIRVEPEKQRGFKGLDRALYADRALRAVQNLPGVDTAAVSGAGILEPRSTAVGVKFAKAELNREDGKWNPCGIIPASPEYADLVGQRLVRGRSIAPGAAAMNEAIVNERFVKDYLRGQDPIGLDLTLGSDQSRVTIVGVLTDRSDILSWSDTQPEVCLSHRHPAYPGGAVNVLVRAQADAESLGAVVRNTLVELDANQPVGPARVATSLIHERLKPLRISALVLLGMAGFGIFMALMGVYGVVAQAVIERTREMGIRMALGAGRGNLVRLIMGEGTRLIVRGAVPGGILALGVSLCLPHEVLRTILQTVSPHDPLTHLLGFTAIVLIGTIAALVPARRMANLKPSEALRHE